MTDSPEIDWTALIPAACGERGKPLIADTYQRRENGTASAPFWAICSDNKTYVIKANQANKAYMARSMIAEQIIGRLGLELGAPVPDICLIDVPADLIRAQPELNGNNAIDPGVAHGASEVIDITNKITNISHQDVPENRSRFALLAILYSWVDPNDPQLFYKTSAPQLVFSLDHGHFFRNGPDWNDDSFKTDEKATLADWFKPCNLQPDEIGAALTSLQNIDKMKIAGAVAAPPDEWGISMATRTLIAKYLWKRRDDLLALK